MFITFEGINASGKTTQSRRLFEFLKKRDRDVILTKEPGGGGEFCMELRRIICKTEDISKDTELFLLYASRCEHIRKVIRPAIDAGKIVVCDRYIDSSFAYQCCDDPDRIDFVKRLHEEIGGLMPDVTFFIDIPVSESEYRYSLMDESNSGVLIDESGNVVETGYKKFDHIETAHMQKIVDMYHRIAKEDSKRIKTIDGTLPEEEINEKIVEILGLL